MVDKFVVSRFLERGCKQTWTTKTFVMEGDLAFSISVK